MSNKSNGWAAGWAAVASFSMLLLGGWWLISGLVAIVGDDFYVVTDKWLFKLDATTWGWIHLIIGIVILAAGVGLFSGAAWARVVGVVTAVIAGLAAFTWLPWYPFWAVLLILASISVVWALTVHGDQIEDV